MNRNLLYKIGAITALVIVLLIPLGMIEGVIQERSTYRSQAKQSIALSWTGTQKLLGPVMVVPYSEQRNRKVWDEKLKEYRSETYRVEQQLYLLPEELAISADVNTEERSRGIYAIPVYDARLELKGRFSNEALLEIAATKKAVKWKRPWLSVLVSDIRGIVSQPQLNWQGLSLEFLSGNRLTDQASGMHVELPLLESGKVADIAFDFTLNLHGMERLEFSPVGKSTVVMLASDWPHPSFIGRYLPAEREIGTERFTARWQVSSFSSDMAQTMEALQQGNANRFLGNTFGVSLMNSVDIYQQTERSVKYGVLFLVLTFVLFFLYEVMKQLRLHPMQYLLVGMALSVFYLLLISLSEHITFELAYGVATLASVGIIGFYLSGVMKNRLLALLFSGILALLYAMLFAILRSEDNALLMGCLLLFGTLALVMAVTRRIDWYSVSEQLAQLSREKSRPVEASR